MQVSELVAGVVAEHGTSVMFGLLGDANLYIVEAFQSVDGQRFIAATHEGEAVSMAAGYAAAAGQVGVATVTHGAITNCITALCDAARGGYPVVVLSGEISVHDEFNLQRLPQAEIVRGTGADYVSLKDVRTVGKVLRRAFAEAAAYGKPVVVGMPSNFQTLEAEGSVALASQVFAGCHEPDPGAIEEAASMLVGSNHPVVVLGQGCIGSSGAEEAAEDLATYLGAPVCTTLRGQGLLANVAFNLGIIGTLSNPVASSAVAASDCLIVFGASLNHMTTLKGELLAGKRIIQFDNRDTAFGEYYPVDLGVTSDVGRGIRALLALLRDVSEPYQGNRLESVGQRLATWVSEDRAIGQGGSTLDIRHAFHRIAEIAPSERYLSVDIGRFGHQALNRVGVSQAGRFVSAGNIAQIGLSVAYGVGAALGPECAASVVIAGDGGFMLGGIGPFNTAVRHEADLIVFVMNDSAYGAEYYRLAGEGLNAELALFAWPDLAKLAVALGGEGVTVRTSDDFDEVERRIASRNGPLLIDVRLDARSVPDPGIH